mmetsp:Transcript_64685/g.179378  ORF Transcript_64685/g.179378 Transcript_64685/m.179378 type:complete len:233 (-) Transcript_64685:145-843(-)
MPASWPSSASRSCVRCEAALPSCSSSVRRSASERSYRASASASCACNQLSVALAGCRVTLLELLLQRQATVLTKRRDSSASASCLSKAAQRSCALRSSSPSWRSKRPVASSTCRAAASRAAASRWSPSSCTASARRSSSECVPTALASCSATRASCVWRERSASCPSNSSRKRDTSPCNSSWACWVATFCASLSMAACSRSWKSRLNSALCTSASSKAFCRSACIWASSACN